jgi:hypothetical protein
MFEKLNTATNSIASILAIEFLELMPTINAVETTVTKTLQMIIALLTIINLIKKYNEKKNL